MKRQLTLRFTRASVLFLAFLLFQETWALAGVTGNLNGIVRDTAGAPIAGVKVEAVAPSQSAAATTDSTGRFLLLSLAPDTYTLNLSKEGYQPVSFSGNVVFADQTQQVSLSLTKTLRTIGHVTSQAGASLVKSGVGGDLYSVNASQAAAAAALGGGGNLNNAYSAMASVPGVQTSMTGAGWMSNAAYVRGQNQYYTGFEYDGIPVNRAFDNYNSSTELNAGSAGTSNLHRRWSGVGRIRGDLRLHQPGHQNRNVPRIRDRERRPRYAAVLPSGAGRTRRRDA